MLPLLLPAALAAVTVTAPTDVAPAQGATFAWAPIVGASSYHLEVDDDPAFGSPEVDVTVAGTSYTLTTETLELHGRPSWPAYVRINGERWRDDRYTPTWLGDVGALPALAAGSDGTVHYLFERRDRVVLRTSADWLATTNLSPIEAFNAGEAFAIAVDPITGEAYAAWTEQRYEVAPGFVPFVARASGGWQPEYLIGLQGIQGTGGVGPAMVLVDGRIELFFEQYGDPVRRFVSLDSGLSYEEDPVPGAPDASSVDATTDAAGNIYIVLDGGLNPAQLLRSSNGWSAEPFPGRYPSVAVTHDGSVVHIVARFNNELRYTSSASGFTAWVTTPIEARFQDVVPLVHDPATDTLYIAGRADDTIQLCWSTDQGQTWPCRVLGGAGDGHADLAIDHEGVVHVAWSQYHPTGSTPLYATSLGSVLACASGDGDADGVSLCDNCPDVWNPDQQDSDGDTVGDACDTCERETDDDLDGDGYVDACDLCLGNGPDDVDSDNICDGDDLCIGEDAVGDSDGDGRCDDMELLLEATEVSPGAEVTLWAYNAAPGARIAFLGGSAPGTTCPPGRTLCSDIASARRIAEAWADDQGFAEVTITAPRRLPPNIYLQAVYFDPAPGDVSNLVEQ
jgi:hypothetical protein